jgi:hypothetical protein
VNEQHEGDPYEGMTNQDVDPVDIFEEMRDAELRMDAADEAAALKAEQDQAAEAAGPDDEETFRECNGYSPDTWCGICEACQEADQQWRDENPTEMYA